MTHDPEPKQPSEAEPDDRDAVPTDAPETKHIEDDGEPLGANMA